ncbi:hypothetical protein BDV28DRAFT_41110 [Aspergillus coremiiformis]|uniref:WAP domain-containing protein n=1 Tax=Aspergillus coremiiformis TaxID=138285 RepID=A0A5N6ZKX7_9EURO|nr:hypothetical protein BDV28DRAFT_41110 [Aspergillus coremiiformis]
MKLYSALLCAFATLATAAAVSADGSHGITPMTNEGQSSLEKRHPGCPRTCQTSRDCCVMSDCVNGQCHVKIGAPTLMFPCFDPPEGDNGDCKRQCKSDNDCCVMDYCAEGNCKPLGADDPLGGGLNCFRHPPTPTPTPTPTP